MNKIWLVIKREYITRVRNKTFLLSTILLPLVIVLFIAGSAFFASKSGDGKKRIAVDDRKGVLAKFLKSDSTKMEFVFNAGVDTSNFADKGFDGYLYSIDTAGKVLLLKTVKAASPETMERIKNRLNSAYVSEKLLEKNITVNEVDSINATSSSYYSVLNTDEKNKNVNSGINAGIGMFSGILIYMTMFIFGAMVMRGVMEEKTNRIAEVIVSSVKPFQLMMGKILGIGAVGLTQLLLWIVLITIISFAAISFLPSDMMAQVQQIQNNPGVMSPNMAQYSGAAKAIANLSSLNWTLIIGMFLFYFIGGYLFYSSLFAAVGSVINEDPQEAQSLMLPIMMPIIFSFIIMTSNVNTPDSPIMVWASIIPFSSPIVMMSRISSSPPFWQIALSMVSLVAGFILTTWFAAKIYRTGILLYGKKASWKEMIKWMRKS
jgi:ABC-2 type transport system permease protein